MRTGEKNFCLSRLQSGLQYIYELDITQNIDDYLITSELLLQQFDTGSTNRMAREKLLVFEDEEGLNLSLYIDETVLSHFERYNPFEQMDNHNMQEFCLVLEGISHFIYLVWNASYDRSVSLIEMELQAEIDKFIMLLHCLDQQAYIPARGQLTRLLFESNNYHADLSPEESKRYREATFYARKYCQRLEVQYADLRNRSGLLAELRKFYRLTCREKMRRILRPH